MSAEVFIDTNILVYAHDKDAGAKHEKARALVTRFWDRRQQPFLSIQVLQEMHVNLVRLGLPVEESIDKVSNYLAWRVIENTRQLLKQGFSVQQQWRLSFWDALIVAAAQQAGAGVLWSEDLSEGQRFGSVEVMNPLKD